MITYKDAAKVLEAALYDSSAAKTMNQAYAMMVHYIVPLKEKLEQSYNNPMTCVVMVVMVEEKLLLIRRKLQDGFGKLALPGGCQEPGETWQQAGAREVMEETGVTLDPDNIELIHVESVENGKVNLIFGYYDRNVLQADISHRIDTDEVIEVVYVDQRPEEDLVAFPTHSEMMMIYFDGDLKDTIEKNSEFSLCGDIEDWT